MGLVEVVGGRGEGRGGYVGRARCSRGKEG